MHKSHKNLILLAFLCLLGSSSTLFLPRSVVNSQPSDEMIFEGLGEIKQGNTVSARREAMDSLLKSAMRQSVSQRISADLKSSYQEMIEDGLVARYSPFVKDYRVEEELGEGSEYRVKARVNIDQPKLEQELQFHGMLPINLEPPKLLCMLAEQNSGKWQAWWLPGTPATAVWLQDKVLQRMRGLQIRPLDTRRLIAEAQPLNQSSPTLENYVQVAANAKADYLVQGTLTADFKSGSLQVVRVADRQLVGALDLSLLTISNRPNEKGSDKSDLRERRQDNLVFHLSGLVLKDWQERWLVERRVLVQFLGVDDLRTYGLILKSLAEIKVINSVQEDSFAQNAVTIRLGVNKNATEIIDALKTQEFLRSRFQFTLKDDRHIEAYLQ